MGSAQNFWLGSCNIYAFFGNLRSGQSSTSLENFLRRSQFFHFYPGESKKIHSGWVKNTWVRFLFIAGQMYALVGDDPFCEATSLLFCDATCLLFCDVTSAYQKRWKQGWVMYKWWKKGKRGRFNRSKTANVIDAHPLLKRSRADYICNRLVRLYHCFLWHHVIITKTVGTMEEHKNHGKRETGGRGLAAQKQQV